MALAVSTVSTAPSISLDARLRLSAVLVGLWRQVRKDLFGGYRPELHYMRGPGPAWRARHGMAERM